MLSLQVDAPRSEERNVGERPLRGFEALVGYISLEVGIVSVVINGVA